MFISVNDNNIINKKRVTTIEIDRDTPNEINYLFKGIGYFKEKLPTHEAAQERLEELAKESGLFIETNDERLVNIMYVKSIEQDLINPKRMIFYLYEGVPVKTTYENKEVARLMVNATREKLTEMLNNPSGGTFEPDGGLVQKENMKSFPTAGERENLYLARDTQKIYYWNGKEYATISGGSSVLEKDITSNVTIGAASAGTTFKKGQSFTEFVEKIAKKDIIPTISTTFTNSGLREIGTTITSSTMALTITNESSVTVPINEIKFYDGSKLLDTQPYVKGKTRYSFAYIQNISTNTTLKAELTYNANNKISGTGTFAFVYASYYGVTNLSVINDFAATSLASMFSKDVKNGKSLTWEGITLNDERFCYMYPKSFGELTSIKDGNGFSQISGYTKFSVNLTSPISGDVVPYYAYLLTDATTGTGFKQIYG